MTDNPYVDNYIDIERGLMVKDGELSAVPEEVHIKLQKWFKGADRYWPIEHLYKALSRIVAMKEGMSLDMIEEIEDAMLGDEIPPGHEYRDEGGE